MSYAFLFGSVGVWVGYVREDLSRFGRGVEAGARIDVRRLDVVGNTESGNGFTFSTRDDGGIWRADLLWQIDPLPMKLTHHLHRYHMGHEEQNLPGLGAREYEPEMEVDPAGWAEAKLRRLDTLVTDARADELLDRLDMVEVERVMPAIRMAIEDALSQVPALSV